MIARITLASMICLAGCTRTEEPTMMKNEPMTKMQLDAKGHGEPLVLVGGGLTGWESWIPHQERLAASREVIRANPIAVQYGLENMELPPGYSIRFESDALAAALDAKGLTKPIDLVAWSFGAFISLDFALQHPDRIRTLTLIEPPAIWVLGASGMLDPQAAKESDDLRALYASMAGDVTEAQLAAFARQAGLVPPGKSPEDLPTWPNWVKHRRSLRTGDATWQHQDTGARLRGFDRPVLLVKGTGSSHFLHGIIDGLAATLPKATLIELPGGHAPQIAAMDEFLARLAAFQRSP